jgi:hypothetical protein
MNFISGSWVSGPNGLKLSYTKKAQKFSTGVDISWTWYDKKNGIVSWNFVNNSYLQSSVILFRNGYYFGNAYFPIYVENGLTKWATTLSPLSEQGIDHNSMPLAILNFGSGNRIVAFVFTLAGGQMWSVLEGGFSEKMPPDNIAIYDVSFERSGTFCIGYDQRQIIDWNRQTGTNLNGYRPNPKSIKTLELSVPSIAPYIKLFSGDIIKDSQCTEIESSDSSGEPAKDDIEEIIGNIIKRIKSF